MVGDYNNASWDAEHLSGKTENLDKICFKVSFAISSAAKDTVKTLNEFQIERT